jgi:hypothetical protein
MGDLSIVKSALAGAGVDDALAGVETFCIIALRVMAKTNPGKLRDIMRTVEIQARLDGIEIVE